MNNDVVFSDYLHVIGNSHACKKKIQDRYPLTIKKFDYQTKLQMSLYNEDNEWKPILIPKDITQTSFD